MTKYVNNNGVSEMWLNIKNWVTSQLLGYSQTGHTHSASDITSGLATVATSGSYNDLDNKPTIPTVNDGTLTIKVNETIVGTFTANQSTDTIVELTSGGGSADNPVQIGHTTQKTGTWTLTGVVPYKPVMLYFSFWVYKWNITLSNNSAAWVVMAKQVSPVSVNYNSNTLWEYDPDYYNSAAKVYALIMPLSSTVNINISLSGSKEVNLYAYQ